MGIRITTNHVPRRFVDGLELSDAERKRFDYIYWAGIDAGTDSATFVKYRGDLLDLSNFIKTNIEGWDGICTDSAFTGVVISIVDHEYVIVGRIYYDSQA
jgi:hypothetical protein